jgi:hypothetical protein
MRCRARPLFQSSFEASTTKMSRKRIKDEELPMSLQLMRIIGIRQAAKLAGMSERTLLRRHADKIVHISPGRIGIRVRDALQIAEGEGEHT